ncbi:BLUF domain-containing protein [Rhodovulum sulfidophilum]|nr:BLUF domain-containing protein [Rhodovulum sulfidophilum]
MLKESPKDGTAEGRLFRIAYKSRAHPGCDLASAGAMAAEDALRNRDRNVTGVLLFERGWFLQWLEGPARTVLSLASAIRTDPRHGEMQILSAGATDERRFAGWPMRLAPPPGPLADRADFDAAAAALAFDRAAALYREECGGEADWRDLADGFVRDLARAPEEAVPDLPPSALETLSARAGFVDALCAALAEAWHASALSGFEVTLATVRLNRLLLRAGRPATSLAPKGRVLVLAPYGCTEIAGAIAKTDLLRQAGYSVRMVPWASGAALDDAVGETGSCPVIVYAGRVGIGTKDAMRGAALAERLSARMPGRTVLLGGRDAGPLCDWSHRLAFLAQQLPTGADPAADPALRTRQRG